MNNVEEAKIIDRDAALARLGGDEELYQDLIQFFLEDAPGLLDQIREHVDNGSEELERAAHSLKGLASNFGAKEAVTAASELEQIGRSGNLAPAPAAFAKLKHEIERLTRALTA